MKLNGAMKHCNSLKKNSEGFVIELFSKRLTIPSKIELDWIGHD